MLDDKKDINILDFVDKHKSGRELTHFDKEELLEIMNLDKYCSCEFLLDTVFIKKVDELDPKITKNMLSISNIIFSDDKLDKKCLIILQEEFYSLYCDLLEIMKEDKKVINKLQANLQNEIKNASGSSTKLIQEKIKEIEKTLILNGSPLDPRLLAKYVLKIARDDEIKIVEDKIALEKVKTNISQTENEINLILKWIENGDINKKIITKSLKKYEFSSA